MNRSGRKTTKGSGVERKGRKVRRGGLPKVDTLRPWYPLTINTLNCNIAGGTVLATSIANIRSHVLGILGLTLTTGYVFWIRIRAIKIWAEGVDATNKTLEGTKLEARFNDITRVGDPPFYTPVNLSSGATFPAHCGYVFPTWFQESAFDFNSDSRNVCVTEADSACTSVNIRQTISILWSTKPTGGTRDIINCDFDSQTKCTRPAGHQLSAIPPYLPHEEHTGTIVTLGGDDNIDLPSPPGGLNTGRGGRNAVRLGTCRSAGHRSKPLRAATDLAGLVNELSLTDGESSESDYEDSQ